IRPLMDPSEGRGMLPGGRTYNEHEAGRGAAASELPVRVPSAGGGDLQGGLLNPALGKGALPAVPPHPSPFAGLIQKIAARKQWLARYEVQRGIVFHPRSPRTLRMNLLHFLGWRDLARLTDDPHCPPPIKRAAESLQTSRVGQMTLGEKVSLARIA